jgi:glycopeptide antibiotics resistance protein
MSASAPDRRYAFFIFLAYLAFVGYGSLVPFELRNYTLDQAIEQFASIGYLELGAASRADWVANIVLYVPLAFLGCAWAVGMRTQNPLRYLAALPVFAFCIAVAIALEFTQIFFAPRTVSLNDLLAETLGSLAGIALFGLGRQHIAHLYASFVQGGRQSVIAAAVVFSLLYVTLSLFPYDFVISPQELASRLESDNQGWLIAGGCGSGLRCAAHQAGEMVAIAPLGLLVALAAPALSYRRIFTAGVALGLVLEIAQLLLVSGISQGLSLLWRGMGLAAGAAVGHVLRRQGPAPVAWMIRRAVPFAALPYILLLAALGGGFSAPWLPLQGALARLAEVRFMPFYYHYFTTESAAVASLFAQAGMYAPVGFALWALRPTWSRSGGIPQAAFWAVVLALPIEFIKLFVPPKHPDPTNLLIVAVGAAFACAVANWMERALLGGRSEREPGGAAIPGARQALSADSPALPAGRDWPMPHPAGIAIGFAAGLLALAGVVSYPVGTPWLIAALLGYGALLWHRPSLLFFAVPALLPALDLSPITGRLWLDEFDLMVLVTLAISYPRVYRMKPRPWPNRWWPAAVVLLWTSWTVASARGLWPLWSLEGGLSDSSHSPLEAWLVGKGLLWALLLMPLMRRVPPENAEAIQRRMLNGLVAGLALVILAVFRERRVFVGLLDFENVFRVTGTFSDMNTGGAYIETFLAFAFPVLAVRVLMVRHWVLKLAGIIAAASVSYAMLVTFSRGGYAGLAAGLMPVALGVLRMRTGASPRRWLALGGVVAASLAVAVPVLSGGFAKARLERAGEDLAIREAHWKRALGLMDDGPLTALAGMGFGQYPMLYLLKAEGVGPPGTYSVMRDGDNPYLRLGAGETVFLDQIVAVEPGVQYTLSARVRSPEGANSLSVALCDKALLYSFECIWPPLPAAQRQWNTVTARVDAANLGGGPWPHRPVKLSLHNPGSGGAIDVDDVSLKARDGRELLANGGFGDGAARWLFVTDQDLAWHIHQQTVEMYFAQGGLGLAALAVLAIASAYILWPALQSGNLQAAALAGALTAFLTVGLLGSTMDTARLSMLFYLGAFAAGLLTRVDVKGNARGRTLDNIGRYRKPAP